MASTWKDKQKSERPKLLKNQHKASRQSVRSFVNYAYVAEEDENANAFEPTPEEQELWDEYKASLEPQEDFS